MVNDSVRTISLGVLCALCTLPATVSGDVIITEIMYDLEGSDAGREWIEIFNTSQSSVDLTGWKVHDSSNHVLALPPAKGGKGSLVVPAESYAILADDATVFLNEQTVEVSVIDTVLSFGQQDGREYTITLFEREGRRVSTAVYTTLLGARGDGYSLQRTQSGSWIFAVPTPGGQNAISQPEVRNLREEVSMLSESEVVPHAETLVSALAQTESPEAHPQDSAFRWYVALAGLVTIASLAYLTGRPKQSDEFEIIEEKDTV